ncbi:anthranilate phosphoribosyltransferase [Canibacter zhoujuaniae]|uniref:anthranilate phosphoribosyltransferase n=1 Tax=Canibacter zhoujuaniae TaxID=2708343 RepID=UPI00141F1788|nr:anthranilate phosphoribosyltransferase [Canibacter zhoujuaniae]
MSNTVESWPNILETLLAGRELGVSQAEWVMSQFVTGEATPAQIGGTLVALRSKGVTASELLGFSDAALAHATQTKLGSDAVDIVGTGGDKVGTVNISTSAAMVIAAAGVPVIKHGARGVSSKSGASDVLAALGGSHGLSAQAQLSVFKTANIAFLNAPNMHPGFAHVAPVRKELGIPTVFNYLGPLCNPAKPIASAIGVANAELAPKIAEVFALRKQTALVFHGGDGLDELTTTTTSTVYQVAGGKITSLEFDPQNVGIGRATIAELQGGDPAENAQIMRDTFNGAQGPVREIVALNAAAGLTAYELATDENLGSADFNERIARNLQRAYEAIDSGAALSTVDAWVKATQEND